MSQKTGTRILKDPDDSFLSPKKKKKRLVQSYQGLQAHRGVFQVLSLSKSHSESFPQTRLHATLHATACSLAPFLTTPRTTNHPGSLDTIAPPLQNVMCRHPSSSSLCNACNRRVNDDLRGCYPGRALVRAV